MKLSRNLDYIFYLAFDSSKGKNRLDNEQEARNLEINILGKLNISKNSGGSSKFPGGLKNDNRFSEHFRQIFASQNTRSGVSKHQDFKIFWDSMAPDPPSGSSVIKKNTDVFMYLKS